MAYTYDTAGRIATATNSGVTSSYSYGDSAHRHAATTIGSATYQYDANGAMTQRNGQGLTWNKLHRLDAIGGTGASTFVYDAAGNRLLRTTGTTSTLYLDGMELRATGSTVTAKRYYSGVAMRTASGVTVLLRNRQNSTAVAYNPVNDTATYQRYTPFGARRGSTPLAATDRRFLDKTEDPSGLVATGARYYDPAVGVFATPDPLVAAGQPRSLASYGYANNNPATLSDPSGLAPTCTDTEVKCPEPQDDPGTDSASTAPSQRGGGSPSPAFEGSCAPTNGWVPPEFVGPVPGPVIRDPASWCLVGQPAGTNGPCGAPPQEAEYDSLDRAQAAIGWLSYYGGALSDAAAGGARSATVSVAGYTTKTGKHVVSYTRYRQGLGDLRLLIKSEKLLVATKLTGRAFVALQFVDGGLNSWTDPDVAQHSTLYRVGHAAASGAGAAAGGAFGAAGGAAAGAWLGAAVTSWTGPGATIGAAVGAALGGVYGATKGQSSMATSYEWTIEAVS